MAVEWGTIASLATAGGTLVLAVSTFASVRSANRAARAAERSLMVGLQPLLVPSRLQDPDQKVFWVDSKHVVLPGGTGIAEVGGESDTVYLAMSVRNAGNGIAVMRSWRVWPEQLTSQERPDLDGFRRHTRDLYVAPADVGFWQAAFRDAEDPQRAGLVQAVKSRQPVTVDVLYGDYEGGQRLISRFLMQPRGDTGTWIVSVSHHWNLDRPDPR
jgi:hypothetical protein